MAPLQQELESDGGDMTAILNGDSFTPGDTITVNDIVEERDSESFVTIEVIDPQNKTVENAIIWITPENEFTHSFLAGVQEDFDFDDPMVVVVSGNYKMVVRYIEPDFDREVVESIFEYYADTASEVIERREATSTTDDESATEYSLGGYNVNGNNFDSSTGQTASVISEFGDNNNNK